MADAPKDKGALVALLGFGKKKPMAEEDAGSSPEMETEDEGMDAGSAAFDAFANALSIPPEKRQAAKEALTRFVSNCGSSEKE